jgi:diguanylate cyclase (GGDEF)-like protein/PAS domain S-box-containing protein
VTTTVPAPTAEVDVRPLRMWPVLGVMMVSVLVIYAVSFSPEPDLDPVDISRETSFFLGTLLIYRYVARARMPLLDVGFLILLTSLWEEVVDEFTFEPRWVGTGVPGVLAILGLILITVAARRWSHLRREREAAHAKAEADLRRSHSTLLAVVEGTPDAVWVKDLDARYVMANTAFARLVGVGAGALVGRREADILAPEIAARAQRSDDRALETGETVRFEDTLTLTGPTRTYLISKTVFRDVLGSPVGILGVARDISDRKAAEDRLAHQAMHDALTSLPNRTAFTQRLGRAFARWQHDAADLFAVLFMDMDRFKEINDRHGHAGGDELLVAMGERLTRLLRPGDVVGRMGGDEFTVLLERVESLEEAAQVAGRVLEGLREPFDLSVGRVSTSVSIGVALCGGAFASAESVLKGADAALYRAKEQGRGRVVVSASP